MCAQTSGLYAVDGIVKIVCRFRRGKVLLDFEETGLDIVVGLLGLE